MNEYWFNIGLVLAKVKANQNRFAYLQIEEFYKDKFGVDVVVSKYDEIFDGQPTKGLPDIDLEKCVPAFYLPFRYSLLDRVGVPAPFCPENTNRHSFHIFDKNRIAGDAMAYWGSMKEYPKADPLKALHCYINRIIIAETINANVKRDGLDRAFMEFCIEWGYEMKDYIHAMPLFKNDRRMRKNLGEMGVTDAQVATLCESIDTLSLIIYGKFPSDTKIKDGLGNEIEIPF